MTTAAATKPIGQVPCDLGISLPQGSLSPEDEDRLVVQVDYDDEDGNNSQDQDHDDIEDQDGAQAVLQPAMSATASHLASPRTPAIEKAAAMEKWHGGVLGMPPPMEDEGSGDNDDGTTVGDPNSPRPTTLGSPGKAPTLTPNLCESPKSTTPTKLDGPPADIKIPEPKAESDAAKITPVPFPPVPTPNETTVVSADDHNKPIGRPRRRQSTRSRASMAVLDSAFAHSRERSRSAGQDALRRLQKAFPSLSSPSHLLPSLPSNFFSAFGEKTSTVPAQRASLHRTPQSPIPEHPLDTTLNGQTQASSTPRPDSIRRSSSIRSPRVSTQSRPGALRRVTSDDSILYHTLSRTSSLGNDEQFHDVRDMVNMRFQAIRESLPEVPNFKMPSLSKLHTSSFISLNSLDMRSQETTAFATTNRLPKLDKEGSGSSKDGPATLDDVLAELTGDIVIMGGLRGSVLRSAKAPHQQVWAPVKIGLNMRKVNLEIGLEDEDEERVEETIIPSGMLTHMGPVDMSRKLFRKIRSCSNVRNGTLRVWDYGYDWRLSPHILSRKLQEFLAKLPSNQPGTPPKSRGALVIAHSMGGLITRHAVNQQPSLFSGVMFAGTPQRCINILGPIRNGDVVLFNEKLLSAQVNFTIRSYYVFLPEDGFCFVDKNTGEAYPVDFYNPDEWVKWHLSPSAQPPLPAFNQQVAPSSSTSSLASFLPTSLRQRAESLSEKRFSMNFDTLAAGTTKDRTIAPQMQTGTEPPTAQTSNTTTTRDAAPSLSDPELKRNMEYLTRTLARTKKFRSELAHSSEHHAANAYPPFGVLYGKTTPTVYAAQVNGREAIRHSDAYDDLLFRPGDGVVLAKEAMLPEGYSIVKGGRVSTERGHITMLADLGAVGQVLSAIIKGRRKGIGCGKKSD